MKTALWWWKVLEDNLVQLWELDVPKSSWSQVELGGQEFSLDFCYHHATLRSLIKYWEVFFFVVYFLFFRAKHFFSPLNTGGNGFRSWKQTEKNSCDNPRRKQNKKTSPSSAGGASSWSVFPGALVVVHLEANAGYLKDSWWSVTLWLWKPSHFKNFLLNPALYETPKGTQRQR